MCCIRCCSLFLVLFILVTAGASAATIDYNAIISAGNSFPGETVVIEDGDTSPSVVHMIDGGDAVQVKVTGNSVFNYYGGDIEFGISALNRSQVNIVSGALSGFNVEDDAEVNLFGGTIRGQSNICSGRGGQSARLNIFGGSFYTIRACAPDGIVNIMGGTGWSVTGHGGTFNVTGGELLGIYLYQDSVGHWSGGELRNGFSALHDDATLHVYGRNLVYDEDELSGTLLDGQVVSRYSISTLDNSQLILHNVPEPPALTSAVLSCASILILANRMRFA